MFASDFITIGSRCIRHCRYMSKGSAIARQTRAMEKLFGNRVAGSKKWHWPAAMTPHSGGLFKGTTTAQRNGKNTTRRMQVLNKLFMENISQLLAEMESVLNRGLQIQRVKISSDFTNVNVYWVGSGDPVADEQLAVELKRHSGLLRHELSQLRLMGEVPRIAFVHDRTMANLTQVDSMLRNMTFDEDDENNAHPNVVSTLQKEEFFGQIDESTNVVSGKAAGVPEMRHDVLGLDHREIMARILAKMKKSKAAWDIHNQAVAAQNVPESNSGIKYIEQINLKLAEAAETESKFDKFLAKRRERKNTPERKKSQGLDVRNPNEFTDTDCEDAVLSANRKRLLHEEDYIDDEHENGRKI